MGIYDEDSQLASFLAQTSVFHLCGFLLAFIGWSLCISATSIKHWREWDFNTTITFQTGVMWIGIWGVCHDSSVDSDFIVINCKTFDALHSYLPKSITVAQDLMSLCAVVETLALIFLLLAYWNIFKDRNKRRITFTFFNIGGFLSLISGIVVLIPVTWNMLSVMKKENIVFPASFGMPSHPKDQRVGIAIHLGFASAILHIVSGLLFLGNKCCSLHKKTHPLGPEEGSDSSSGADLEYCPHCGSSLNILASGHHRRFCEAGRDKERQKSEEEAFKIPMGPIPDQRVAPSDTKAFRIVEETAYF